MDCPICSIAPPVLTHSVTRCSAARGRQSTTLDPVNDIFECSGGDGDGDGCGDGCGGDDDGGDGDGCGDGCGGGDDGCGGDDDGGDGDGRGGGDGDVW